ncbi:MAG TPA: thiol:disulfide interchange protein DsbA/DsbL [Steroidobacteraceae bacterium]|nr:thiol:disulfide interchange protein DsbA/DsbL [Steroidobacteraceae bacterium]
MNTRTVAGRVRQAFLAGAMLLAAGSASAAVQLQQGVNYTLLQPAQPTSVAPGKVEVVEVFWYACGHCYLLEPRLEAWNRNGRPANAELVRLPATWNNVLKTHARVFYTMELLGKHELNPEIWREINVKGNRLDTPEKIEAFFTSRGVSKADFQRAFASFAMDSKVAKAEDLNRRYKITGTPTIVVNGKYVTDVSMAGSEEKLFEVVNALVAKESTR